jgi:hypothetical protein
MIALFCLCVALFVSPFKSKSRLEAENAALRHQLIILRRKVHGRVRLTGGDRLFFIRLYRWFPSVLRAITIVRPETLVRWHRAGFRRYWRWKSRASSGVLMYSIMASSCSSVRSLIGLLCWTLCSRGTSSARIFKYAAGRVRRTRSIAFGPPCRKSRSRAAMNSPFNCWR